MTNYSLKINNKTYSFDVVPDTPLLWVLRDALKLYGTKYGCGIAQCGACTVHIDGLPMRSCSVTIESVKNKSITTIEGLSIKNDHPVQLAWEAEDVPQCGYCQSGQIMTATALLNRIPNPTDDDINRAMKGNICRCGTYSRIRNAIKAAAKNMKP
ncbi:isoquinoline 1-oxidoreductase alpha subunit [Aquimarina sp. MAR_2010_214]|uniref:(2Fe-2S)-binding protein n=1 Tax=Aquimarina sp. MAR_2010_214 TaxID=1250026 RepID=UPI000C709F0E|nr:(2Fe-2S)-binding protein [Aquimarina sp. MAR_2010_214]PKV49086.1 isoquinoline 1-oxidoreductase alpha subunit [Aquimarina sp. MAR_2010_214]